MRALTLLFSVLLLAAAACGGSSGNSNRSSNSPLKDLHDPKIAATATLPAQLPSPLAAANAPAGAAGSSAQPDTYVVKAGDTLGAIASGLNVSVGDLETANGISDPTKIQVGQQLRIPRAGAAPPTPARSGSPLAGATPALSAPGPGATVATGGQIPPTGGAPSGSGAAIGPPAPGAAGTAAATAAAGATAGGAGSEYSVKSGDTGCSIARAHQISLQELGAANGLSKDQLARLTIGQLLKIPAMTGHRDC